MKPTEFILAAITGAIATATIASLAQKPPVEQIPTVHNVIKTEIVYSCDNLPEYSAEENGAIRELRVTCAQTQQALLLIEQWEQDPQANIVYE